MCSKANWRNSFLTDHTAEARPSAFIATVIMAFRYQVEPFLGTFVSGGKFN